MPKQVEELQDGESIDPTNCPCWELKQGTCNKCGAEWPQTEESDDA